jgi:predicted anti-sigma-YlaC factor YlaD
MNCTHCRELLEPYIEEELSSPQREAFRGHLRSCPQCRGWAVGVDPTLVFSAMEPVQPDSTRVESCAESVVAQIRQQRLDRMLRPRRRPWLAAAAAMIVAVAAGTAWRLSQNTELPVTPAAIEVRGDEGLTPPPPQVQVDMTDEGVRIYQYADDDDSSTAVYYIVNPALES